MITPYYYQREAVDSIFQYFEENEGNPLICLPTGTGKSVVISFFCKEVLEYWPYEKLIICTHDEELVKQNHDEFVGIWPSAPAGINCDGLNRRDWKMPIIFCTIGSIINNVEKLGHRSLFIIDEAHRLSPNDNTMYRKVISSLQNINPYLKVIGLTATPFRVGQGMLTDDGLFTDICYNMCTMEKFNELIDKGYLAPLIPKPTGVKLNLTGVKIQNGDYNKTQLQKAVDKDSITRKACDEAIELAEGRRSWVVFCSGIDHANHVADYLQSKGIEAAVVHSKIPKSDKRKRIDAFKRFELRCLVTNNMLTTGFNHKALDLIVMLRPTTSPGLWVQMLGRGTRPFEGKENCLVLDFARNTLQLGPINDPQIPRKKGKGTGEAPIKICPECDTFNHLSARFCICCEYKFPSHVKITSSAGSLELIKTKKPDIKEIEVIRVEYDTHIKFGSPPSAKITYVTKSKKYFEWICLENSNKYIKQKAEWWWKKRTKISVPKTVSEFLNYSGHLKIPKSIRIDVNKKYPEIIGYKFK